MKQLKLVMAIVILLWVSSMVTVHAQDSKKPGDNIPALKGLVPLDPFKITPEQGKTFNPTLGKDVYFEDGTSLTGDQFMQKMMDPNIIVVPYVKKEDLNTILAMLIRRASAEEKEAKEAIMKKAGMGEVRNLGDGEDINNPELMKPIEFDPNTKYEEFTKGLTKFVKKPGDPVIRGGSFSNPTRVAFFDPEGKFIPAFTKDDSDMDKNKGLSKELCKYFFNVKDYVNGETFVDGKNTIKAIKFRKATMEERKNAPNMASTSVNAEDAGSTMASSSSKLSVDYENNTLKDKLVGTKAGDINVIDINGNKFNMAEAKGKVVVLNFWYVECMPCREEMPLLNKLVDAYKGKDVEFIGVATNNRESLIKFLKTKEFKYRIISNGLSIANTWEVGAFPTNIVIDKKGKIILVETGYVGDIDAKIKAKIEEALKK
ncbi:TlpA family protein disulfide reductase [Pedobacter nyackensis]|uniref:Peroxiredoxin n=1 Tax=Pedobacter nyackensis TaxID=475255 RepID=A0A1W2ANL4_9SPHI|nr:TlpA disulfide reductase family protein [Pedobacter nyackensis]SMC62329.1 Peroxiredoxin [Pedobacter nyackensis]